MRHHQTPEGTGRVVFLLWTFAVLAGVRGFARLFVFLAAEEEAARSQRGGRST